MAADRHDDALKSQEIPVSPSTDTEVEREMRDAEQLALAASGLGSGLLARAVPETAETVAVLRICPQCGVEYETSARFCPSDGTALRPKGSDSLVGRVLADRYHILKRIGEGGMGRVYLGEHVKMNRQCAIKVMSPALVNDHESAARFAREASSAARIIHPHVAAVFDYGESEGLVYLVMEFVEGEPLSRILAREAPLSVDRSLELARQIADGLGAAHDLGIVHRDLKPDNILISRNKADREVAKVVDFGIAKAMKETAGDALTRTGLVIGTPEFMSPEQLLGDPIDARSDLYALGCIMHLMLTASPPFAAPTREQMIKRRLTEDAPHVQQLDPGLPDSLNRIVARLLARSPSDRYGSAVELRDALAGTHARRLDADGMVRSMRPTPRSAPTLAFESAALAPTEKTEMVATVGTRPRRRATLLALGAVALTGAAFAAMSTHGSGAASPPPAPRAAVPAPKTPPITRPLVAAPVESAPRKVVPVVDSAALRRARARRDSIARANAAARAGSVEAEIARYARAIASGSVNNLKEAYPNLTDQQQAYWETNFFAKAERISATVRNIRVTQTATRAEADFTVIVGYDYKTSSSGSTPLKQHAVLMKTPTGWRITEIR